MRYLSVCSGIEAATVAWHHIGWEPVGFSEIEPFPSAVLKHHYPDVPNLGSMTEHNEWRFDNGIDLLVGGTPCQAFSIAGKRGSLDDERGNLSLTFCNIADQFNPEWVVWENVPGVLNTKDNAFGCFLAGLAGEDVPLEPAGGRWTNAGCVYGPKRAVAWRVLDAQYFGVAQRRRRVFVIANSRGLDPSKVLFEFDSLRWDTPPSRETGERVAPTVSQGSPFSCTGNERVECDALVYNSEIAPTIPSRSTAGGGLGTDFDCDGGLITTFDRQSNCEYGEAQVSSTVSARDYKSASDLVAYGIPGNWIGRKPENGGNAVEPMHNVAPCQTKTDVHAVAFKVRCGCEGGGKGYLGSEEQAFTLSTGHDQNLFTQMQVRRLTPTECERLQAFPDGYTNIPWRNKPESPDGPRYKALGNSMCCNVMRWIGERINNANNL